MKELILSLLFIIGAMFVVCLANLVGLASAYRVDVFSEQSRLAFDLLQS